MERDSGRQTFFGRTAGSGLATATERVKAILAKIAPNYPDKSGVKYDEYGISIESRGNREDNPFLQNLEK